MNTDLFKDRAADYDQRPVPQQISEGVVAALIERVALTPMMRVLDFGAGTGLLSEKIAPRVAKLTAVDISESMLAKLVEKPALRECVEVVCQNLLEQPLGRRFDLVVSAMAAHHVEDTAALLKTLHAHVAPGGTLALADLDSEDGTFHPPGVEGVFHAGFDREALVALLLAAGFKAPHITTACEVSRDGRAFPIFLATAQA
jgi:2-polyprenyl-3-methyl-5-hydroxy-6-metoxy-1,4-benzoquinol methylase